jgi:hypothetical protein
LRNGEGSSSTAAELTEDGDKAEGVLQLGSSGARIPLYGRSVDSILQVMHAPCIFNPRTLLFLELHCTGADACSDAQEHAIPEGQTHH